MSELRTAAKEALWAFQCHVEQTWPTDRSTAAIAALRAALAQQDEPVAFDWPKKACPCRDVQNGECLKLGCKWERDPSLVPEALRRQAGMQQAEPVQEPVAWYQKRGQEVLTSHPACWGREDEPWTPLYAAPPQRQPLTEKEIDRICASLGFALISPTEIVRAVERAHGIGETK